jgi:methylmalonyl-CoA mutase N-terminal domain/subunit
MRQFAGFGGPEETNERFRYLLEHGQTGLSTAFDMPSLMGHDSDHPRSNAYTEWDESATPILRIDPALECRQVDRLHAVKAERNTESVETALRDLKGGAGSARNLMPLLVEAARVHTSEGEIVHALQQVSGDYRERPVF